MDEKVCIYRNKKRINGCSILNDDVVCDPDTCVWGKNEEEYFQSLLKAKQNYEKATGRNDYTDRHLNVIGKVWKQRFLNWYKAQERVEQES